MQATVQTKFEGSLGNLTLGCQRQRTAGEFGGNFMWDQVFIDESCRALTQLSKVPWITRVWGHNHLALSSTLGRSFDSSLS